ncbi:sulfotransferase family protein [Sphingobium sp. TomTYG45]
MVSREEVIWAYKALLGREPESENPIAFHCANSDFEALRRALIRSPEGRAFLRQQGRESQHTPNYNCSVAIFLHLPKTGGTSLFNWLAESFLSMGKGSLQVSDPHVYTLEELSKFDFIGGHFNYQTAIALPRHSKKLITCFRNPVDRLISLYRYYRTHPDRNSPNPQVRAAQIMSAEEFFSCDEVRGSVATDNCYLHTFSDALDNGSSPRQRRGMLKEVLDRLSSFDEIALTDGIEDSVTRLVRILDFTAPTLLKKENVTDDVHSRHVEVDDAKVIKSKRLLEALEPLTDFDCEVFDFARKWARERSIEAPSDIQASCGPELKAEKKLDLGSIKTISSMAVVSIAAWGGVVMNDDLALRGVDAPDKASSPAFAARAG